MVEGAGGVITTWEGGDPQHGGSVIACGDPALHRKLLTLIAGLRAARVALNGGQPVRVSAIKENWLTYAIVLARHGGRNDVAALGQEPISIAADVATAIDVVINPPAVTWRASKEGRTSRL